MTSKERLLCALRLGKPDRVPVCPDISFMYPAKYSGRPYWDPFLYSNPPVWKMIADLAVRFGFDAMIQIGLDKSDKEKEMETVEIIEDCKDLKIAGYTYRTPEGILKKSVYYPVAEASWNKEPLIKDVEQDYKKLFSTFVDPMEKKADTISRAREYAGDCGIVGDFTCVPSFYWCVVRGSIQDAIMDYYDYPEIMEKFTAVYSEYALEYIRASCEKAKPDYFMFAGSYASMSVISPEFYRKYNLPFVQKAAALLKKHGVMACVHMCGKSNEMVGVFANETDINMLEPLERPPGGNVNLSEVKRKYGKRLCLKGCVNTFDTLAKGTPVMVEEESRKCIEDAAEGGGFILSSGDQVPGDTPEENFKALIGAAYKYGSYE